MGFYFALLYMVLLILSPAEVVPALAPYRLQLWLAGLATLLTAAMLPIRPLPRSPQPLLMVGFLFAIMASWLAQGSIHGARMSIFDAGSDCLVFFVFVAEIRTVRRIRLVVVTLVTLAGYMVLRGILAYHFRIGYETYIFEQPFYLDIIYRARYVGQFSDPNDLAQFFVVVLPFAAMLWKRGRLIRNFAVTLPILSYLGYGIYLTHSRGVLIGLVAVIMLHLRTRYKSILVPFAAAGMAVVLLAGMIAGDRSISFGAGSDRIEAWGVGIALLRAHPITGAGFNSFTDHHDITAHNSFVLCFAELGLVGFFFWLALIVSTLLQLNAIIRQERHNQAMAEVIRWAISMRLAFVGFLATAWFLSRTYIVLLWILLGIAVALIEIAKTIQTNTAPAPAPLRGQAPKPLFEVRWAPTTAVIQVACVFFIYILVRLRWSG